MNIWTRAQGLLNMEHPFGQQAEAIGRLPVSPPKGEQMILRMMVRSPKWDSWQIPSYLDWLTPTILKCDGIQKAHGVPDAFVYVTVRHGPVVSVTDDLWHVDGFSMRLPHRPEQNYIWADHAPTELLYQPMTLPEDFDPMRHNIHQYFQDQADESRIYVLRPMTLYVIDPYVIHRRPQLRKQEVRTFFRISFVPIEIEDDTCTVNPLMPRMRDYGRQDIRTSLIRYV